MLADAPQFEVDADTQPLPSTPFDRFLWPLCLLLAWLTFELTANATLSVVLGCLKFGMNDFRTAAWLWKVDPLRPRARACTTFYVASGIWKTAVVPLFTAGGIAILWGMIAPQAMQRAHPVTIQLFLALQVGMWAAATLIFFAGSAVVLSLAARWRVWVHPNLHRSRKAGTWPPQFSPSAHPQANQAVLILLTAVFALVVLGPVVTLLAMNFLKPPAFLRFVLEMSVVFGYPIFGVMVFGLLRGKLFAQSPWECWPESIREIPTFD